MIGRDAEIERVIQILGRRKKNNPVLIGEAGVGKSAIIEGLALRITQKKVPHALLHKRIFSLDVASLVAGTKYRGQFEERINLLLKELSGSDVILFIDEIHTIVGAGSTQGSLDTANILKPALARGELQCIGATTLSEYRENIESDSALERRFQKIIVEQPSAEETLCMLNNIKKHYESHHRPLLPGQSDRRDGRSGQPRPRVQSQDARTAGLDGTRRRDGMRRKEPSDPNAELRRGRHAEKP